MGFALHAAAPRRLLSAASLLLLAAHAAAAQRTFEVRRGSAEYDMTVRVEDTRPGAARADLPEAFSRKAQIRIHRKGARSPFQVINLPNIEVYEESLAYDAETEAAPRRLYEEEYSFVFDDFNFDGRQDFAVCNGREGGYGGPSYTVFLFDRRAKRFAESRRLSRLTEAPYLGLFFPDPKTKRLVAHSKSGCCYHATEKYAVVNSRPVLVEKVVEDATLEGGGGEGFVVVTTRKRVGGRWVVRRRKEKIEEGNAPD
ncbi:MAG TPA: hypothetical protein VD968_12545 [Pyrinomonadaceae bacterium]|nr:hypothetical protein [Pyrinomonadaceae bacterium]